MSYQGNQQGQRQQRQQGTQRGFAGNQGRGADQGAADARHTEAFREDKAIQAEFQPRDPQTGQFVQEPPSTNSSASRWSDRSTSRSGSRSNSPHRPGRRAHPA